jgi:hypothetical protein
MFEDGRVAARVCAGAGASIALFATFLPWYSFEVVLPTGRFIHVFAVTTTLWGFTTVAPILLIAGSVAAVAVAGAFYGRLAGPLLALMGLAILVYGVVRCFDVPNLGIGLFSPVGIREAGAVTELEGGPFVELGGGLLIVIGALGETWTSRAGATVTRPVSRRAWQGEAPAGAPYPAP